MICCSVCMLVLFGFGLLMMLFVDLFGDIMLNGFVYECYYVGVLDIDV